MSEEEPVGIVIRCTKCNYLFSSGTFEEPFGCPNCGEKLFIFLPKGEKCQIDPKNVV